VISGELTVIEIPNGSPKPDGPLTEKDIKEIAKLKEEEMKAVDNLLLSHARNH
jgi:hypothetical protein